MADTDSDVSSNPELNLFAYTVGKRSRQQHFAPATKVVTKSRRADGAPSSLDTLVDLSHQSHQSPRPTSGTQTAAELCSRCAEIDFARLIFDADKWEISAINLGCYSEIIVEPRCPLCDHFSLLIERFLESAMADDKQFYLVAFPTSALYGDYWIWKAPPTGVGDSVSFSIMDDATFNDAYKISQAELVRAIGCIGPLITDGNQSDFQARLLNPIIDVGVLKSWLNFCTYHHAGCCNSISESHRCATAVIDCGTRKIVPLKDECRYLTLSYVWGMASDERQAPPATIEDAMILTLQLGYSYLWVDRYCIPQQDGDERRLQVSQMGQIYAGADINIIAAAGKNPEFGLPGVHHRPRAKPKQVKIRDRIYTFVPPDPAHELKSSIWNSRAWTYQESVLSRRRLIFCEQQVYFECSAMHCYEAIQTPLHLLHSRESRKLSAWNESGLFSNSEDSKYPLDQLFTHLAPYTIRELTYPTDILNGMLGIFEASTQGRGAGAAQRFHLPTQIGGIPILPDDTLIKFDPLNPQVRHSSREEQFITGLWWKLEGPSKRRAGFPSWSWAGWHGNVLPRSNYQGYISNTHNATIYYDYLQDKQPIGPQLRDLESVLSHLRKGSLMPGDIPLLKIHGQFTPVQLIYYPEKGLEHAQQLNERRMSKNLGAVIHFVDDKVACEKFFLDHNDDLDVESLSKEPFMGWILGVAQGTYYAGETEDRTLDGCQYTLVIMVLWKPDVCWERFGLIEHNLYIDTTDGVRNYLDLSKLRVTHQSLWLS